MGARGLVVVTGASGFIALHVVRTLLEAGYAVRGSVRLPDGEAEVRRVMAPLAGVGERLQFARLDLGDDTGWAQALQGADALIHMASPFPSRQPRDADALVRPAVDGTLRALRSAASAGVNRVIVTSSIAAIINAPLAKGRTVYDERDWSDPESRFCNAYSRSKTLAERAAWRFVESEAPHMRLTSINPGFVLGPGLGTRSGTSLATVARMLTGKDPLVPKVGFPAVDVRDVARLHVEALALPAAEGERFLAADRYLGFPEMAKILQDSYPDRKIATRQAPDWLVRILARFDSSIGTILPDLGRRPEVSSDKARRTFGIAFIPARDALLASARSLAGKA